MAVAPEMPQGLLLLQELAQVPVLGVAQGQGHVLAAVPGVGGVHAAQEPHAGGQHQYPQGQGKAQGNQGGLVKNAQALPKGQGLGQGRAQGPSPAQKGRQQVQRRQGGQRANVN